MNGANLRSRTRGLRCRADAVGLGRCIASFIRDEDEGLADQRHAVMDRALHEARAHGFCYLVPLDRRDGSRERRGSLRFGAGRTSR